MHSAETQLPQPLAIIGAELRMSAWLTRSRLLFGIRSANSERARSGWACPMSRAAGLRRLPESGAEAVTCIANQEVTWQVVRARTTGHWHRSDLALLAIRRRFDLRGRPPVSCTVGVR